jgi:hypothetical protein
VEIPEHIDGGKGGRWIAHEARHGRRLVREILHGLNSPSEVFAEKIGSFYQLFDMVPILSVGRRTYLFLRPIADQQWNCRVKRVSGHLRKWPAG